MTPITNFVFNDIWQFRLRDGRNITCDGDGSWWLTGQSEYYHTLFSLLVSNNILTATKEGRDNLLGVFKNSCNAQSMSDGELIDKCLDLFSDLPITSEKDSVLQEILTRFQKAIDLDETPQGITANGYPVWDEEITE